MWQEAFTLAADAYLKRGSAPIGALVIDSAGNIVSRGCNAMSAYRLAHAEMEAFAGVPQTLDRRKAHLYVTVEPCPMCTGAARMMQIGSVHYAAKDPAAGSTHLLRTQGFMLELPCAAHEPSIPALEQVVVALVVEHRARTGHARWEQAWTSYQPKAAAVGKALASAGAYERWLSAPVSPEALYESVLALCTEA